MDAARFDALTRSLGSSERRAHLGNAVERLLTSFSRTSPSTRGTARATATAAATTAQSASICDYPDRAGLQQRHPGDLVAFEGITPAADATFPAGARAWRVLYVSTGRDNTDRILVCGVVVAPSDPARIFVRSSIGISTGRVVAWCHGTLGMIHRCQPSVQPASQIWGQTPYGINTLSWSKAAGDEQRTGIPGDGILAGMIDAGWIVAATDYYVGLGDDPGLQPYVIGKIEAANTIDSIRAAHHLLTAVYAPYAPTAYDVVNWGHSQGGHAALWTGQLLADYAAATGTPGAPALALSGVALAAPAANFITQPDRQPGTSPGFGDLDWLANSRLELTSVPDPIPVAPFFFSYLFGTWAHHAASGAPVPSQMPAYPPLGPLDAGALVMPGALSTVDEVNEICWADGAALVTLTAPYADRPFLRPAIAHGTVHDGLTHGNLDATCAGDPAPEIAKWCAWLRYNLPGPLGVHPMAKLPQQGDHLVPVMIAQGSQDTVVHCVVAPGTDDLLPSARDCMSVALYESLAAEYCPDGATRGHLSLMIWQAEPGRNGAAHSDIAALHAAASPSEPSYQGSPLQRFILGAFEGTLPPGCSASVANPATHSSPRPLSGPR